MTLLLILAILGSLQLQPTWDSGSAGATGLAAALQLRGTATWCAPTPTNCQRWGGNAHLGAVPSFRWGDKPYRVTVTSGGRSTTVTVVSFCACGSRNGVPTVIDLSPAAFRDLAPLSRGVIPVTVTIRAAGKAAPQPTLRLPETDTGEVKWNVQGLAANRIDSRAPVVRARPSGGGRL